MTEITIERRIVTEILIVFPLQPWGYLVPVDPTPRWFVISEGEEHIPNLSFESKKAAEQYAAQLAMAETMKNFMGGLF